MTRLWVFALVLMLCGACTRVEQISVPERYTGEVGNGGHGVKRGEKVYSLDLVQGGIEKNVFYLFEDKNPARQRYTDFFLEAVYKHFFRMTGRPGFPFVDVARKLLDIHFYDPLLAMALLRTMEMHSWRFIKEPLKPLAVRQNFIDFKDGEVILVANRLGQTVYIHEPTWDRMDKHNQTALILHELFYALIRPVPVTTPSGVVLEQPAARVREIIGYFFRHDAFLDAEEKRDDQIVSSELPVLGSYNHHWVEKRSDHWVVEVTAFGSRKLYINPTLEIGTEKKSFMYGPNALPGPVLWDHLRAFCKDAVAGGDSDITIGIAPSLPGPGRVGGYFLAFADFREEKETKRYVDFAVEKRPTPITLDSPHYSKDTAEECLADLKFEVYLWLVAMDGLTNYSVKLAKDPDFQVFEKRLEKLRATRSALPRRRGEVETELQRQYEEFLNELTRRRPAPK